MAGLDSAATSLWYWRAGRFLVDSTGERILTALNGIVPERQMG